MDEPVLRYARPIVLILLVLLGGLCIASASNRVAADGEHKGVLGRLAFGPGVLQNRARLALENHGAEDAARFAREAVAAAPLDPYSLALLGSASLVLERYEDSDSAFRAAAQLGWRDASTQRYWFYQSLAAGAYDLAAQRLDALLRTRQVAERDAVLVQQLLATPEGRAALVDRMELDPVWLDDFIARSATAAPAALPDRLATVELARSRGITFDPAVLTRVSAALVRRGELAAALRLAGSSNAGAGTLLANGDFERTNPVPGPFDWKLTQSGELSSEIGAAPSPLEGHALSVVPATAATAVALRRTLVLSPGRYRMAWRTAGLQADTRFEIAMQCMPSHVRIDVHVPAGGNRNQRTFSVPDAGAACRSQAMQVLISPSLAQHGKSAWIDDIVLQRVDQSGGKKRT